MCNTDKIKYETELLIGECMRLKFYTFNVYLRCIFPLFFYFSELKYLQFKRNCYFNLVLSKVNHFIQNLS